MTNKVILMQDALQHFQDSKDVLLALEAGLRVEFQVRSLKFSDVLAVYSRDTSSDDPPKILGHLVITEKDY